MKKQFVALAVAAALYGSADPASAQLSLICYTLHNDLANFDRRSRSVEHYTMPDPQGDYYYKPNIPDSKEPPAAGEAALENADSPFLCLLGGECDKNSAQEQTDKYLQRRQEWLYSRLGGFDPVRLRIINEMDKLGCPLSDDDKLALKAAKTGKFGVISEKGHKPEAPSEEPYK